MNLVAAIAVGVCCALGAATVTGSMPRRQANAGAPTWLAADRTRAATWLQQAGVGVGPSSFVWGCVLAGACAVMMLPWLVLVALTARPGAFRDFYRSSGGVLTLLVAGVLTAVGVIALGRLAREPVEVRPLATEDRA